MPSLSHLQRRRTEFLREIDGPVLLLAGGARARNYPDNVYPFRADGSFLFFFNASEADAAALFDPKDQSVTVFLHERTPEGALWHGPVPDFAAMREQLGVSQVSGLQMNDGRGFGGIRIEDDVVCTANGNEVLTAAIVKERREVEGLVGK